MFFFKPIITGTKKIHDVEFLLAVQFDTNTRQFVAEGYTPCFIPENLSKKTTR
jgi:hypothetical protein